MVYIEIYKSIKLELLKHCREVPHKECGGFLYGNMIQKYDDIICKIDYIYYEKRYGTSSEFNFGLSYIRNAQEHLEQLKSKILIGTYHSHGTYPAIFSQVDREQLQPFFGKNKITMIYSPSHGHLICDFLNKHGQNEKAKIITL